MSTDISEIKNRARDFKVDFTVKLSGEKIPYAGKLRWWLIFTGKVMAEYSNIRTGRFPSRVFCENMRFATAGAHF